MKRLLMAVLLLTTATLLVPELRERAAPRVQAVAEWSWERAKGPLAPVVNPFRRIRAETELGEIGRRLVNDRNQGRARPEPEDFTGYIVRNRILQDTLDPWGRAYRMTQTRDSVLLISAGPDGIQGTDDDVVLPIHFPWRDTRRRIPLFR